jgi:hypothetical protein
MAIAVAMDASVKGEATTEASRNRCSDVRAECDSIWNGVYVRVHGSHRHHGQLIVARACIAALRSSSSKSASAIGWRINGMHTTGRFRSENRRKRVPGTGTGTASPW